MNSQDKNFQSTSTSNTNTNTMQIIKDLPKKVSTSTYIPGLITKGLNVILTNSTQGTNLLWHMASCLSANSKLFQKHEKAGEQLMVGYYSFVEDQELMMERVVRLKSIRQFRPDENYLAIQSLAFGTLDPLELVLKAKSYSVDVLIINGIQAGLSQPNKKRMNQNLKLLSQYADQSSLSIIVLYDTGEANNAKLQRELAHSYPCVISFDFLGTEKDSSYYHLDIMGRKVTPNELFIEQYDEYAFVKLQSRPIYGEEKDAKKHIHRLESYGVPQTVIAEVLGMSQGQVSKLANSPSHFELLDIEPVYRPEKKKRTKSKVSADSLISEKMISTEPMQTDATETENKTNESEQDNPSTLSEAPIKKVKKVKKKEGSVVMS